MSRLSDLLPTADDVLALGREQVAVYMLEAFNSVKTYGTQKLHRGNYLRGVVEEYRGNEEVAARVGRAWDWAVEQEFLIQDMGERDPSWVKLSAKGLAVKHHDDVQLPRVPRSTNPGRPPNFRPLTADGRLAKHLVVLWEEAAMATSGKAHLAAVIMLGSLLEGALLARCMADEPAAHAAVSAPKSKGIVKTWNWWSLNDFIQVSAENGWIRETREHFSQALREYRNLVHPFNSYATGYRADEGLVAICWEVVRATMRDLGVGL